MSFPPPNSTCDAGSSFVILSGSAARSVAASVALAAGGGAAGRMQPATRGKAGRGMTRRARRREEGTWRAREQARALVERVRAVLREVALARVVERAHVLDGVPFRDGDERGAPCDPRDDVLIAHERFVSFTLSSQRRWRAAASLPWPGVAISLRFSNILPVTLAASGAVASHTTVSAPTSAGLPIVFVSHLKNPPVSLRSCVSFTRPGWSVFTTTPDPLRRSASSWVKSTRATIVLGVAR